MKKTPSGRKKAKGKKVKGKSKDNRETVRLGKEKGKGKSKKLITRAATVSSSFLLLPFYFCLDLIHQHARI